MSHTGTHGTYCSFMENDNRQFKDLIAVEDKLLFTSKKDVFCKIEKEQFPYWKMSKLTSVLFLDAFLSWDSEILVFMTINLSPFTKPTISSQAFEKNHKFSQNRISKIWQL